MKNQLKYRLHENSFVMVDPQEKTKTLIKKKTKKRIVIGSLVLAVSGLVILFLIDGGIGIVSASIIEVVKWSARNRPAYLEIPTLMSKL